MPSHSVTIRELAVTIPGATRLFDELRIDYCCGGERALLEVCRSSGLDIYPILASLHTLEAAARLDTLSPSELPPSLGQLIDHIVATCHREARRLLDTVEFLVDEAFLAEGDRLAELPHVSELVLEVSSSLRPHMFKEEHTLFPYIVALEAAERQAGTFPRQPFGEVDAPIAAVTAEHETASELMRRVRDATGDYHAPRGRSETVRELYDTLADLDRNLREHIHLQNNALFPRAVVLEYALR